MTDPINNYEEFRVRAIEIANNEIAKFTIPIFETNLKKKFKLRGSGVFIKIGEAFYLLTAAHVIRDQKTEDLYIPGFGRSLIPIGGEGWYYLNDNPDVAIVRLEPVTALQLSFSQNYLPNEQILIDFPALDNQELIVVGYPELFFKHEDSGGSLDCYTLLLKKASKKAYKYHNINPKLNYALRLGRAETIDGFKMKKPEPYGMSGCGLWFVTIESLGPPMKVIYRLVGLMYGYRMAKHQVIIASKIRSAFELLQLADQN